ncbi:enoyl-CoA hydratase/isomerase family protein [Streptomyces sp. UG1]|uniref:enoyl-CoA hydratase/isomerase family protein n=1 Tax=Streptomyces sp. UG1 TaxID=3417652 RepID=UPI003CEFAADF
MKTSHRVLYEVVDGVAWITLNRRDALNAADRAMVTQLRRAWRRVQSASGLVGAVVIGAGVEAFSLGLDRSGGVAPGSTDSLLPPRLDVPLVAAVNGAACAEAWGLVGAADGVVAARHARLSPGRPPVSLRGGPGMSAEEASAALVVDTVVPLIQLRREADRTVRQLAPAGEGCGNGYRLVP